MSGNPTPSNLRLFLRLPSSSSLFLALAPSALAPAHPLVPLIANPPHALNPPTATAVYLLSARRARRPLLLHGMAELGLRLHADRGRDDAGEHGEGGIERIEADSGERDLEDAEPREEEAATARVVVRRRIRVPRQGRDHRDLAATCECHL